MGNLTSRNKYSCVLLDILCLLCCPFLQRKGPESAQEYNSLSAECILHAFHETLDYQGNGLLVNPLFLGDPLYNICFSHITVLMFVLFCRLGRGKSPPSRSSLLFLRHFPCLIPIMPFKQTFFVSLTWSSVQSR